MVRHGCGRETLSLPDSEMCILFFPPAFPNMSFSIGFYSAVQALSSRLHKEDLLFLPLLSDISQPWQALSPLLVTKFHSSVTTQTFVLGSVFLSGWLAPFREGSRSLCLVVPGSYRLSVYIELMYG